VYQAQEVSLSPTHRRAWLNGAALELSPREFDLLQALISRAGCVVSRAALMRQVWPDLSLRESQTLDSHLGALRRKLGDDPRNPRLITTVRGQGLRFEQPSHRPPVEGVLVCTSSRRAWLDGAELSLTALEFDMLHVLISNAGHVVSREQLMRQVWKTSFWTSTYNIDLLLHTLRRKLGDDPRHPRLITTLRGRGLRYELPGSTSG
jgi:DNA-binding response OmpR family regulator